MMTTNTGTKKITLRDIAKHLDISHATVSRALNGTADSLISQKTIERVQKAASELGYRPNHAARALVTGRTGLVGLWLWTEHFQGSYHARVSAQMHLEAMRKKQQLLIDLVARPEIEGSDSRFDAWNVDGIIAHESSPALETQLRAGHLGKLAVVSTGTYNLLEGVDQVRIDMATGAQQAMNHLVGTGRKRIAYVTDDLRERQHDARYLAYSEAIREIGQPPICIETEATRSAARQRIKDYLADNPNIDAIFCHNDDLAIGVYRGLCDLNIKVPDRIALVGCDGIEDCEYLEIPLSTIVLPMSDMCRLAMQFLDDRLENPERPVQNVVLQSELIVRESS